MRVTFNAPVILTFTAICVVVRFLGDIVTHTFFTVPPSIDWANPLDYFLMFSHIIGHGNWEHLIGNFTFILLLGPMVEEKYGSRALLTMILITGGITGLLNVLLFSSGLLGASGIVFMLIILSSMTNIKSGTIPITFILIAGLYLGNEVISTLNADNISQFAHIIGGIFGSVFGFAFAKTAPDLKPETNNTSY